MVDLHIHSCCSDGTDEPEALAAVAAGAGLSAAVLTDHDTMAGSERFVREAARLGLGSLPGLEISCDVPGRTVHVLAYGCDAGNAALADALRRVREGRNARNAEILARLSRLGRCVSMGDVMREAGEGATVVGRPHIARALVRKGWARDHADAFRRYLGRGAPAYVERFRLAPGDALALISGAGGVSSLAHPHQIGMNKTELRRFVESLAAQGLGAIECLYTGYVPGQVEEYVGLARDFGLLVTGGTDYHGENRPHVRIGVAYGGLNVSDATFDALSERIAAAKTAMAGGTAKEDCRS